MTSKQSLALRLYEYQSRKEYANSTRRKLLQSISPSMYEPQFPLRILFIFGFQRSGTTATLHNIRQLFGFTTFEEFSPLSEHGEEKLRFASLEQAGEIIYAVNTPYVIAKPLVESQQANRVLKYFDRAKGVWLYRNYKDVVRSFVKRFGDESNRIALRRIAEGHDENWWTERIPEHLRQLVRGYDIDALSAEDATALFWLIRNQLYFHYDFNQNERLPLVRYESWVANPDASMRKLLDYIGYPAHFRIPDSNFHQKSVNKGADITIKADIDAQCQELLQRMDDCFHQQGMFV